VDGFCDLIGLTDTQQWGCRNQPGFSLGERLWGEALYETMLYEDRANGIHPYGWSKHTREMPSPL
jgi:hypothetical protein